MTKSKCTESVSDAELLSEMKEFISYNPITGHFTFLKPRANNKVKKGQLAGSLDAKGYLRFSFKSKVYKNHRTAWFLTYGYMPEECIDHINGNKTDNRISNLRKASNQQNVHNQRKPRVDNKSGFLGVSFYKSTGRWKASIGIDNKIYHIGYYLTPKDAHQAYLLKKREIHGFCTI